MTILDLDAESGAAYRHSSPGYRLKLKFNIYDQQHFIGYRIETTHLNMKSYWVNKQALSRPTRLVAVRAMSAMELPASISKVHSIIQTLYET